MPEVKPTEVESTASIKVVGVGGAGGSAVDRMREVGLSGVEFVAVNTDAQALHHSDADTKVHIGRGLGAGGDPEKGREAAEESRENIGKALDGADMVFITLGAGGGTGSGAGPIVAQESHNRDILTVGVVTKPFTFEGAQRKANADVAIEKLSHEVDALITIPNDRLLQTIDPRTPLLETFKIADDVLRQGVQGISELITEHSLINLDFADVKAIMKNAGSALMGIGRASGENRAVLAAQQAIESPLIEVKIEGARGVLFSVAGGYDMSMSEIQEAAEVITSAVAPDANIIFGASIRPELEDEIIITVVATGFDSDYYRAKERERQEKELADSVATATVGDAKAAADTATATPAPAEPENHVDLSDLEEKKPTVAQEDFAKDNKVNMWDSIRSEDEDLDVPPSLRAKLRGKK
ncbi:cell division protein FtsZ [Candidatus Saccharibacteria bacterium]|nr:cell division protein FtsZ [Candidatus Saccharibacteria bacterium]MBR3233594.1 cell division protein FtsZ [Candidatus Saccharibacteria bacterium]